jgi:hypothetical protein
MSFLNINIPAQQAPAKAPEPGPGGSDTKPAPASGPTSVSSTPSGTSAPTPAADTDSHELDFGFGNAPDADTDDSDGGDDDGSAPAAEIVPLGPPEGSTKQQQAEWRAQHAIPETAEGYKPPTVEGITWDQDVLSPIAEIAREHHIPQPAFEAALAAYAEQVAVQQASLKRQDKERLAEVKRQLTPSERSAIDAAASVMSKDLRSALKQARLPSGELLLGNSEFLHLLANLNRQGGTSRVAIAQNDAARERAIRQLMKTDYHSYITSGAAEELTAILNRKGEA